MDLEKAKLEFIEYTDKYRRLGKECIRKINHTFRVMDLCGEIAESLNLSDEEIKLAKLCGLLHDLGRFEQWKRYKTFNDMDSIDHGDLAVTLLKEKESKFLRKFISTNKYDSIILNSIKYHNKYSIDEGLSEKEELYAKIVRDADKIDIIYLYTIEEITRDTNNQKFSKNIFSDLLRNVEVARIDKKNKADDLSTSLGFVFDINFKYSFHILKEQDYYNKEIDIYEDNTNNEEFIKQLEVVRKEINKYIKERL
ncbi:MAG: HD domain-containing protein [Bacilli bacterium]|nr:HD domain-containing protein [Bacilli bacterium]